MVDNSHKTKRYNFYEYIRMMKQQQHRILSCPKVFQDLEKHVENIWFLTLNKRNKQNNHCELQIHDDVYLLKSFCVLIDHTRTQIWWSASIRYYFKKKNFVAEWTDLSLLRIQAFMLVSIHPTQFKYTNPLFFFLFDRRCCFSFF